VTGLSTPHCSTQRSGVSKTDLNSFFGITIFGNQKFTKALSGKRTLRRMSKAQGGSDILQDKSLEARNTKIMQESQGIAFFPKNSTKTRG
jgi:hypothetical protein